MTAKIIHFIIKSISNQNPKLFKDALDLSEDANNKTNDTSERRGNQSPQTKVRQEALKSASSSDINVNPKNKTVDIDNYRKSFEEAFKKKVKA